MVKIKEHKENKTWWLNYIPDKVLDKIKEITGNEKFNDTKSLIDMRGELPVHNTFINVLILMTFFIKDGVVFYPKLVSEKALFLK